jgi:hypothetical protein
LIIVKNQHLTKNLLCKYENDRFWNILMTSLPSVVRFETVDQAQKYIENHKLVGVCEIVDDFGMIGEVVAKCDPNYDHPYDDPDHITIDIYWKEAEYEPYPWGDNDDPEDF